MDYSRHKFEHLFKDNYPHMYRMAFSMVENADDAKDAVHQAKPDGKPSGTNCKSWAVKAIKRTTFFLTNQNIYIR